MSDRDDPGRVSSFCHHGGCVQVTPLTGNRIAVGSTERPAERVWFTAAEWAPFLAGVKAGEFDLDGRFARLREREAAGETETYTEYRVYVAEQRVLTSRDEREVTFTLSLPQFRDRTDVRIDTRTVTRTTTPWEEQR